MCWSSTWEKIVSAKITSSEPGFLLPLGYEFGFIYQFYISEICMITVQYFLIIAPIQIRTEFLPQTYYTRVHQRKSLITGLRTLSWLKCTSGIKKQCITSARKYAGLTWKCSSASISSPNKGYRHWCLCFKLGFFFFFSKSETSLWYKLDNLEIWLISPQFSIYNVL